MAVKGGPFIFFNIKDDIDKQLAKLVLIRDKELMDNFNKKTYIDLRYGDKVYYK
jgi:hypothetical protein